MQVHCYKGHHGINAPSSVWLLYLHIHLQMQARNRPLRTQSSLYSLPDGWPCHDINY